MRGIRIRTLLLAMFLVSIALWVVVTIATDRRRAYLRDRADSFAFGEADIIEQIADKLARARQVETEGPEGQALASSLRIEAERLARLAAWHVKMERKYVNAVEHPWSSYPEDGAPPDASGSATTTQSPTAN